MAKTVAMPVSVLNKMKLVISAFNELENELEDYLLSQDADFINKMKRARNQHLSAKTKPLKKLKEDLCIK